jgi:hypothetical protein
MATQERTNSGWKDNLKSTQENFRSLQLVDAKLDTEQITNDIDKVINNSGSSTGATRRSSSARGSSFHEKLHQARVNSSNAVGSSSTSNHKAEEDLTSMADIYGKDEPSPPPPRISKPPTGKLYPNPMNPGTPGAPPSPTGAPESADRSDKHLKFVIMSLLLMVFISLFVTDFQKLKYRCCQSKSRKVLI